MMNQEDEKLKQQQQAQQQQQQAQQQQQQQAQQQQAQQQQQQTQQQQPQQPQQAQQQPQQPQQAQQQPQQPQQVPQQQAAMQAQQGQARFLNLQQMLPQGNFQQMPFNPQMPFSRQMGFNQFGGPRTRFGFMQRGGPGFGGGFGRRNQMMGFAPQQEEAAPEEVVEGEEYESFKMPKQNLMGQLSSLRPRIKVGSPFGRRGLLSRKLNRLPKPVAKAAKPVAKAAKSVAKAVKKVCHLAGTPIRMADGSIKNIELLRLGDELALGGRVLTKGESFQTEQLYNYNGILVTGSHAVFEDDTWLRVEDSSFAFPVEQEGLLYPLVTENNLLVTGDGQVWADMNEVDDTYNLTDEEIIDILNSDHEKNRFLQEYMNDLSQTLSVTRVRFA